MPRVSGAGSSVFAARQQFVAQTPQRGAIVHIIPCRQKLHFHADFLRSLQGLLQDALRAPIDLCEQAGVRSIHPNQIISAVVRGPEHDAVFRFGEPFDRDPIGGSRHGGAVGIDQAERVEPDFEEVLGCGGETIAESFTALQNELEVRWQNVGKRLLRARRSVNANALGAASAPFRERAAVVSRRKQIFNAAASSGVRGGVSRVFT